MTAMKPFDGIVPRQDARDKVTGRAQFGADAAMPNMLYAKALRSAKAHARIVSIDTAAARALPGVHAMLTRDELTSDIRPFLGPVIMDKPIVAIDKVRYEGDIVAAVAAVDERTANQAVGLIKVVYEELPAVGTIEAALADGAPELYETAPEGRVPRYGTGAGATLWPRKNVCYDFTYEMGTPDVFAECDFIFEDEFRFPRMNHFHLEPYVTVAHWTKTGIDVISSIQDAFVLRRDLSRIFGMPDNCIKVRVLYVGGAFGGKAAGKTETIAILLSRLSGRPVRFCMTLEECFLMNSQHEAILRVKTGVMKDGTLIARDAQIFLNAGAYSGVSPRVAEKAGYRIPGAYRYKHVKSSTMVVMTNTTPAGAFRGFGGNQASWACESQIDMIAHRLGIDPYDMRCKNVLRLGEPFMPCESSIDSDLVMGLDLVAREIGYHDRIRKPNRGMGLSIGLKDGGGISKAAQARLKVSADGEILLHCGLVEFGQGGQSAMARVTAEILNCPTARIRYFPIDTDYTPFDTGSNSSAGIVVYGHAVELAALDVKRKIMAFAARMLDSPVETLELENWCIRRGNESIPLTPLVIREFGGIGYEFTGEADYRSPTDLLAPLDCRCPFWEIGWGAAEVEVDPETGKVVILKLAVSGDAGRAINKLVCKGQEDGAALMGLGQALFERMIYDDTRLINGEALLYRVPLAEDIPAFFTSITQEQGHGPGPFGAKGVGEGTMLPIASAVANAIYDAVGVRITELPLTPERVLEALSRKASHAG